MYRYAQYHKYSSTCKLRCFRRHAGWEIEPKMQSPMSGSYGYLTLYFDLHGLLHFPVGYSRKMRRGQGWAPFSWQSLHSEQKTRSLWEKHLPMPWPTGQHFHVIQIQFRGVVAAHKKRWTRWTNTDELTHDAGLVFSKVPWIGDWQTSLFKSFTAKWETCNRERPLPNASFSPSFYGWTILKNWLDGVASQSNPVGYIFGNKFGSVGVITPGSLAKSWILLHVLIQYSCGISQQGPLAHLGTSFWFLTFQAELLGTHSSLSILPNNTPTDVSSMQAAPSWQV